VGGVIPRDDFLAFAGWLALLDDADLARVVDLALNVQMQRIGIDVEALPRPRVGRPRTRRPWPRQPAAPRTMVCQNCGARFTARRSDARYCSDACRVYAWRARRAA
jgi:hypothetical protein